MAKEKRKPSSPEGPNSMMLRRTLFLLAACGIVAFLVLGFRLFKLQLFEHEMYESRAIEQQVRDTVVNAARGTIYDTNMKILAMSASVDDIFISPKEIKIYGEDPLMIAQTLSELLGVDAQAVFKKTQETESWYKTIAKKVEPEVSDKVREFINENNLKGVHLEENTKRYYPYSNLASHVIGFVGMENTGLAGIESYYDRSLTGVNGRVVRAKNAAGTDMLFTSFEDYYDAQDGNDVVLTIDSTIQYYIEKHLEQAIRDYKVQNGAAAIAMDVKTGAILGMVSFGNFDLNNYQALSDEAQALLDAQEEEADKRKVLTEQQLLQWRNKALSDTYEPGSTFKIITLSMALNDGVVKPTDSFFCGGSVKVPGDTNPRKCWKTIGHGSQTLTQALQHSCNVAFINTGVKVGEERFYDYCEAFGFFNASENHEAQLTGKTGIDLEGESGSIWWPRNTFCNPLNQSQLAAASFGQTFNITPLQLITAVSACCNGGNLMKPYVVKEIREPDGKIVSRTEPSIVRQVISENTSETVCHMLEQVVGDKLEGTGRNAYVAGYRIGGKTGTSTNTTIEATTGVKQYIVSFLGVAPMDDPQVAVLVLLDSPENNQPTYVSGGSMGAPTVGNIMEDILPYLGVEPQYTEDEQQTIDRAVPKITGLSADDAKAKLAAEGFTYRVIGEGGAVTAQIPAPNSVVAASSQVLIYCGAEPSAELETVPDLTGTTYSIARQTMGSKALFIKASGPITDPSAIVVSKQSIEAGAMVEHGTVVEVTVSDNSMLGRY